jgi:phosphoribosyl-ATP pyrophosphohydrolase
MEPEKDIFEQWQEERESRSWLRKKLDSISLWWEHNGRYLGNEFIRGIENLWYWLPVIWKDRNWDHQFIFDILSHKLKAQSAYIGGRDIHQNAKRDAEVMMTCVRLIEKVKDEYYGMEYMDYHKTKHWFEPADKEGYSTWESRELEENFDDYFAKYPLIYKRVMNGEGWLKIEDENDKDRIASNIAHINHDRARKLLFKIIEQNIEKWWD